MRDRPEPEARSNFRQGLVPEGDGFIDQPRARIACGTHYDDHRGGMPPWHAKLSVSRGTNKAADDQEGADDVSQSHAEA
jgi:hypothetical protein